MASNTTFISGQILTATMQNNLEWGVPDATAGGTSGKSYIKRTANYTLTGSEATITGMTTTFTAVANRIYRVSFHGLTLKNTAAGSIFIYLKQTVGATTTYLATWGNTYAGSGEYATCNVTALCVGLAAGATTIEATAAWDGAAGGTLSGSASNPSYLWVEDIGAAT
jgi:hypothetical protein